MQVFVRRTTPAGLQTFRLELPSCFSPVLLRKRITQRLSLSTPYTLYAVVNREKVTTTQIPVSDNWSTSVFPQGEDAIVTMETSETQKKTCNPYLSRLQQVAKTGNLSELCKVYKDFERHGSCSLSDWDKGLLDQDLGVGWTCLHLACEQGHTAIVEWLLDHGCDVNAETVDGWTPLSLAATYNHCDCIRILSCTRKLLPGYFSDVKGTALDCARKAGHSAAVELLLSLHSSVESSHRLDRTASLVEATRELEVEVSDAKHEEIEVPPPFTGLLHFRESEGDRSVFMVLLPHLGLLQRYTSKDAFYEQCQPEGQFTVESILEVKAVQTDMTLYLKSGKDRYFSEFPEVVAEWQRQIHYSMRLHRAKRESFVQTRLRRVQSQESLADSSTDTSMEKDPEVTLQDFQVMEVLGAGSFGRVYKVIKRDSGQIYALKALDKRTLIQKNQLKHALNEAKIHYHLNSPYIVKMHYKFQTPRKLYFVLDYCPNGDLGDLLSVQGALPEDKVKIYLAEALLALEYLHSREVLYRDMKPDNLLLDSDGHVKLADLGLATEISEELNTTFCGTLAYLSPEMLRRQGASKASDVYGWGAVAYELLTGDAPYYSPDMARMLKKIKKGKLSLPWRLSAAAKSLLTTTLSIDPAGRPDTAALKSHPFFNGVDWGKLEPCPGPYTVKSRASSMSAVGSAGLRDAGYSEQPSMEECLLEF